MFPDSRCAWQNPRVLTTLLLIFLCGAAVGAFAMRAGLHRALHPADPYWKEGGKEISLQRFKKDLNLTPSQAQQMETVLDDFMMYYQTLQGQMDEVRASGKDRVMRILDDKQRKKFETMISGLQAKQLR
jgi:Spy/CpxP family protein refolding chaperone